MTAFINMENTTHYTSWNLLLVYMDTTKSSEDDTPFTQKNVIIPITVQTM